MHPEILEEMPVERGPADIHWSSDYPTAFEREASSKVPKSLMFPVVDLDCFPQFPRKPPLLDYNINSKNYIKNSHSCPVAYLTYQVYALHVHESHVFASILTLSRVEIGSSQSHA